MTSDATEKSSYRQILKSSSIMGGAASINMLLGMVRTKFSAVIIGVGGVGLIANFTAIQLMIGAISGLGLHSSGVRDIASAVGDADEDKLNRAVLTLRRMSWLSGILGLVFTVVLSPFLSQWTFGHQDYQLHIAALGLVVLFINISDGQMAVIQGMRRISDLAKIDIISAVTGTIASVGFYLWLGLEGIVPVLVLVAATQLLASKYFLSKLPYEEAGMTWSSSFRAAGSMVKLGVTMVWQTVLMTVTVYFANFMINRNIGVEAVGIYSAAYAISTMFVVSVLNAMGSDFYPRLTSLAGNAEKMVKLINEQIEVGVQIITPGLIGLLAFAPLVMTVFYTSEFLDSANLIHWLVLGCYMTVISYPVGYVMMALNKSGLYFYVVTSIRILHLVLITLGLFVMGLQGVAIAYMLIRIIHFLVTLYIAKRLINFTWSSRSKKLIVFNTLLLLLAFINAKWLDTLPSMAFGGLLAIIALVMSLRGLLNHLGSDHKLFIMLFKIPGMRWLCKLQSS